MSHDAPQSPDDAARGLRADNEALRAENAALRAELAALRAAPTPADPAPATSNALMVARACVAFEHLATLRGLLRDLDRVIGPRAASAAPRRPASAAPCLPVEVWVHVMARMAPVDVFALARTCRAARTAATCRGAWLEVDLGAVDDRRRARHDAATPVVDLTQGAPRGLRAPRPVAAEFADWLAAHPAAASGISRLVLPPPDERSVESVHALLRHCTSLKRLLNLNRWRSAQAFAFLAEAADARLPLEHAHVNFMTPDCCAVLQRLPLRSLLVTYEAMSQHARFTAPELQDTLDVASLEALIPHLPQLTRLELDVCTYIYGYTPLRVESDSLSELIIGGKGLVPSHFRCPQLVSCRLEGCVGYSLKMAAPGDAREEVEGWSPRRAVQRYQRLLDGCPRLRGIDGLPIYMAELLERCRRVKLEL